MDLDNELGVHLDSTSPAEVNLLEPTLVATPARASGASVAIARAGPGRPHQKPRRLIADQVYDSDPWHARLACRGIDLTPAPAADDLAKQGRVRVAPHQRNWKKLRTQDGRKLRLYPRR